MKEINEDLRRWFKEKWVDISKKDGSGKHPPCGRKKSKKKGYPKCRPSVRVSSETPQTSGEMSAETKKKAVSQKRRAEKKKRKNKKPIMTSHHNLDEAKDIVLEGLLLNEGSNKPTNPKLWSRAKSLARKKFKVYPSAYANGWAAKWYKKHGGGWKSMNESVTQLEESKKLGAVLATSVGLGGLLGTLGATSQTAVAPKVAPAIQQKHTEEPKTPAIQIQKKSEPAPSKSSSPIEKQKIYHREAIKQMLVADEGIKTKKYKDTKQIDTVGIGHNLQTPTSEAQFVQAFGPTGKQIRANVLAGGEMTKDQVIKLFDTDVDEHIARAVKLIPNLHEHPPEVQAVLVSGVFRGHVGDAKDFRKKFNSGDIAGAAQEVLNRKEYKNPERKADGSLVAPGVLTRLERDNKVLANYAKSKK